MAKTPTERVREFRERQRAEQEAAERAAKAADRASFRTPFAAFLKEAGHASFSAHWSILGDDWWNFDADEGLKPRSNDDLDDEERRDASNSLGKAERILSVLEDITDTLAEYLNAYKRKEITDRIHEIETSDLSGPDTRTQALTDIVRLKKMVDQLDRPRRRNLPRWEVTGE